VVSDGIWVLRPLKVACHQQPVLHCNETAAAVHHHASSVHDCIIVLHTVAALKGGPTTALYPTPSARPDSQNPLLLPPSRLFSCSH
jgi:hypothetical protein